MERSVRDFKNLIQTETTAAHGRAFPGLSEAHSNFWAKLNRLGWAKKTKKVNETNDVDASAPLTKQEWDELYAEFKRLH